LIYLHIGRNKAGSTTLQDFFLERRAELGAMGVTYAMFGHLKDSQPGVPGFGTAQELADYARAHPQTSVLISNEIFFPWPRDYTDTVTKALKDFDVKVIGYIRPYGDWVRSTYAQEIHMGINARDFDAYMEMFHDRISGWPAIEGWGEGVGWPNMHIRAVDPRCLTGGNLLIDCLTALGVEPDFGRAAFALHSNASPHWMVLEMVRSLIESSNDIGWDDPFFLANVYPLKRVMQQCVNASPNGSMRVQYQTAAQLRFLAELYNRDLALLADRTGTVLPAASLDNIQERPFLPSIRQVPADIMADFAVRVRSGAFRERWPGAADIANRALDAVDLPASARGWAKVKRLVVPVEVPTD